MKLLVENYMSYFCPVKLLCLLFACYILVLSCGPCYDNGECDELQLTGVTLNHDEQNGHQHENEACTPFCICSCCGQHYFTEFQVGKLTGAKPAIRSIRIYASNNMSLPTDYFGNIWQPPQLV